MDKQKRAKELLKRLKTLKAQLPSKGASIVDDLVGEVSTSVFNRVADGPILGKIEELAKEIANVKHVDVSGLTKNLQDASDKNDSAFADYSANMDSRLEELVSKMEEADKSTDANATVKMNGLLAELEQFRGESETERTNFGNRTSLIEAEISKIQQLFQKAQLGFATKSDMESVVTTSLTAQNNATEELKKLLKELETTMGARLAGITLHGGNMNRNVAIGGNTSVLSRYTDINWKAGANVTITYAYNDATKYTDVTVATTGGGGGSVTGIIRSINNIAVSTAAGNTAGTDYVYLASGTLNVTLPTSIGNLNMYTVKNVGAGTITVLPTGAETVEGAPNITMPVQYTSVDLISNNSGNWNIT